MKQVLSPAAAQIPEHSQTPAPAPAVLPHMFLPAPVQNSILIIPVHPALPLAAHSYLMVPDKILPALHGESQTSESVMKASPSCSPQAYSQTSHPSGPASQFPRVLHFLQNLKSYLKLQLRNLYLWQYHFLCLLRSSYDL